MAAARPTNLLVDSISTTNNNNNQDENNSINDSPPNFSPLTLKSSLLSGSMTPDNSNLVEKDEYKTITTTIITTGAESILTEIESNGIINLRPIPPRGLSSSKISKSISRTHTFTPRISHFDRDNLNSQKDQFRGFYTLFWISIFLSALRTTLLNYNLNGTIIIIHWENSFANLISEDAKMLALSDTIMVSITFLCVPFIKILNKSSWWWFKYEWTGCILQHLGQTLFLALAVRWTFYREWPWVQSGFMTLHTLSTLMKVHSYLSFNGELSDKNRLLKIKEVKLKELIIDLGGNEKLEKEARENWEKEVKEESSSEESSEVEGKEEEKVTTMKEFESKDEIISTGRELNSSSMTRRRSTSRRHSVDPSTTPSTTSPSTSTSPKSSTASPLSSSSSPSAGIDILTWHPNSLINSLAIEIADLRDSLISNGDKKIQFPENVTMLNFLDYLLVPTLVYQLEYPRTDKIRPLYILEKSLATLGTLTLLILIVEHYILPISPSVHENSFFTSALDLAIPFMINYLLIFYIIFECICNLFAELTRFADREFYQDWWNSTNFEQFSRKWNIPVHAFLLRHVYSSTRTTYKFSKFQASFVTFLLSALVHELVMAVVTQKIRLYLFLMQMTQLPMIYLGNLNFFKQYPALGNLFFWLGLLSGFPLLAVAYIRF